MLARYLRALPWVLASIHAALTILVFGAVAIGKADPMLPIIVAMVDFPLSELLSLLIYFVGEVMLKLLTHEHFALMSVLDALVYLVLGSAWWFGIGKSAVWLVKKIQLRFQN